MSCICITQLDNTANEESTFIIVARFTDEDGNALTPKTLTWSLSDEEGNIINSRLDVVVSSLASTVNIPLTGDDLQIGSFGTERRFTLKGTYDSTLGNDFPITGEVTFFVNDLVNVS